MADLELISTEFINIENAVKIIPRGFIDTTNAPDLENVIEEHLEKDNYKIIIDLQGVDFVSSAGWGIFVSEISDISDKGGDLVLINMQAEVYDVYEIMEFSSILKSFDSEDEAAAYIKGL